MAILPKLLLFTSLVVILTFTAAEERFIETFSSPDYDDKALSQWTEQSDTVRSAGKSKATITLQKTSLLQRAILFTLLNPLPNGAAFAGVRKFLEADLSSYKNLNLFVRGQGQFVGYKAIFTQEDSSYAFCHFFEAPKDFGKVTVALSDFEPYFEGKIIDNSTVKFDPSKIVSIGIQAYGGFYRPVKQAGAASLEIDWISAD